MAESGSPGSPLSRGPRIMAIDEGEEIRDNDIANDVSWWWMLAIF